MKIIGQLPARLGSQRVKQKNLRPINGKPLIGYAIEACLKAETLTELYVNTESDLIGEAALKFGAKFYKRPEHLATDTATQDEFNFDFINKTGADVLVLINPVCPLITALDIDNVVNFFLKNKYNTVVTTKEEHLHAFCEGRAVNFDPSGKLPRTQDIPPVQICNWAIAVWNAKTFVESFKAKGSGAFHGEIGLYPIHPLKGIKISTEEDFLFAETILSVRDKINV